MKKTLKVVGLIASSLLVVILIVFLGFHFSANAKNNPNKVVSVKYGVTLKQVNDFAVQSLTALRDGTLLISSDYKIKEVGYHIYGKNDYAIYIEVGYHDGMGNLSNYLYCAYTDEKLADGVPATYYPLEQLWVMDVTSDFGTEYSTADKYPQLNVDYLLQQINSKQ